MLILVLEFDEFKAMVKYTTGCILSLALSVPNLFMCTGEIDLHTQSYIQFTQGVTLCFISKQRKTPNRSFLSRVNFQLESQNRDQERV